VPVVAVAPNLAPALRALRPASVTRHGGAATIWFRFSLSEPAAVGARVTRLGSTSSLPLLRRSTVAGKRTAVSSRLATARVNRPGSYVAALRLDAKRLVRGRAYLLRLTATDAGGKRRLLTVRVRG
jgi:hypothetical protein